MSKARVDVQVFESDCVFVRLAMVLSDCREHKRVYASSLKRVLWTD